MENRINIQKIEPNAYKGMLVLENFLENSALSKKHYYLIFIRASQINGCAFCINKHIEDALQEGETHQRIFLLNAWKETALFTEEERVVLSIAEEITCIQKNGLSTETYEQAMTLFNENYIAQLIMAAVTINGWNRIAISTNMQIK